MRTHSQDARDRTATREKLATAPAEQRARPRVSRLSRSLRPTCGQRVRPTMDGDRAPAMRTRGREGPRNGVRPAGAAAARAPGSPPTDPPHRAAPATQPSGPTRRTCRPCDRDTCRRQHQRCDEERRLHSLPVTDGEQRARDRGEKDDREIRRADRDELSVVTRAVSLPRMAGGARRPGGSDAGDAHGDASGAANTRARRSSPAGVLRSLLPHKSMVRVVRRLAGRMAGPGRDSRRRSRWRASLAPRTTAISSSRYVIRAPASDARGRRCSVSSTTTTR